MGSKASKLFVPIRDTLESAATLAGNYYLPGSALLTDHLVSKGSQEQLNSPLGKIATIGSGLAGSGVGESFTGIPSASTVGGGWTNTANNVGGVFGAPDLGTSISEGLTTKINSIGSGLSSAASDVGKYTGLSDLLGSGASANAADVANGLSPAETAFLGKAAASTGGASSGGLSSLLSGSGGGGSSYLPLLGAANSMYANDKAQKDLLKAGANAQGVLEPYLNSGTAANSRLSDLLGTSGNTTSTDYDSLNTPFTAEDLQNDPGYKFQLEQGNRALDRQQAARGGLFSGAALKAAADYGQGLADTTYKDAYARDQAKKAQTYGMFSGQSGQGQSAAGASGAISEGIGNAQAAAGINSANIVNQSLSSLLSGSGAKRFIGYDRNNQPIYA